MTERIDIGEDLIAQAAAVLEAARAVWILVTGEHKARRVAEVLTDAASTAPAARIARAENVTWYLDDAAALKLPPMEEA